MLVQTQPVLRRAYDIVALFAVLNLVGISGMLVVLFGTGAVTGEQLRRGVQAMRAPQTPEAQPPAVSPSEEQMAHEPEVKSPMFADAAANEGAMELLRLEADRLKIELDQKVALANSIMLRVTTERESFKREQDQAAEASRKVQEQHGAEGFAKQIAIYEELSPKVAMEHLLSLGDASQAAAILMALDTRKSKKIVETAKDPRQREQMILILKRLSETAPERSAQLKGDGA